MTRRLLFGCSATFVGAFDFGFLALAAPGLDADLDLGAAYPWLFSAGSFAYGAVVMPAGAQAGRIGLARMLGLGLLLASMGTVILGVASGLVTSLAGRVLFGLGGGISAAPALALIAAIEDPGARHAGFARLGAAGAVGFTAGALLGALAEAATGWRVVLAATAAVLTIVAWLAFRFDSTAGQRQRVPGAGLIGAATVAVAVCFAAVGQMPSLALSAVTVAVMLAWTAWRRAESWRPRAGRATFATLMVAAATMASGVGPTVLLARDIPVVADASPAVTALVLSSFGLAVLPALAIARLLAARLEPSVCAGVGLAMQALGLTLLATAWAVAPEPLVLAVPVALFAGGMIIASAAVADAATDLARESTAAMGGLLVTAQYVGAGIGSLVVLGVADRHGVSVGLLLAVSIACGGAALSVPRRAKVDAIT